jgi:uncharacterized protein with NRDE domain
MCLIAVGFAASSKYPLVVAANRDERHARAAVAADWWADAPGVLGGRDLLAGGSWLAMNRNGRLAAVTNRPDHGWPAPAKSRGSLVADYVRGSDSINGFSSSLAADAEHYGGFNLLLRDADRLSFVSNRERGAWLTAGVHAFGNTARDTRWPKLRRARDRLAAWLQRPAPIEALFDLLAERAPRRDDVDLDLSSAFVLGPVFGTRCSTIVLIDAGGDVTFTERRFDATGKVTGESRYEFAVESTPGDGANAAFTADDEPASH